MQIGPNSVTVTINLHINRSAGGWARTAEGLSVPGHHQWLESGPGACSGWSQASGPGAPSGGSQAWVPSDLSAAAVS